VHFPAWPPYPLAAPEPWASFIRAIPCYEHIKSLSITLRRREEKLWQTQSSDSIHCLPSSNGELFPVVLGLFAMAVLGYGDGSHDRWFAKCGEDFATSRSSRR